MKKLLMISVSALALSAGAAYAQSSPQKIGGDVSTGDDTLIQQIGTGNSIGAAGGSANAGLKQSSDGTSGNWAEIYQGWNGNGDSALATEANSSTVSVTQTAAGDAKNSSRTYQIGSNQSATTIQYSSGAGNFISTIEQTNSGNTATVKQGDEAVRAINGGAESYVLQQGTNGKVEVTQFSAGAYSSVTQTGVGNDADADPAIVNVSITQDGDAANHSEVTQNSDYSTVVVTQNGGPELTNNSYITQYAGVGYGEAHVTQDGAGGWINTSNITQYGGLGDAVGNYASVTQTAIAGNNTSDIYQTNMGGALNQVILNQTSTFAANTSSITQSGSGNVANVLQNGPAVIVAP